MRRLPDHLRIMGDYGRLWARAQEKQRTLEGRGLQNPGLADLGLTTETLLHWYFDRRGQPVPPDTRQHAVHAGFADEHAFMRAVMREYCYVRARVERPANGG
jgi:hypothetical protein